MGEEMKRLIIGFATFLILIVLLILLPACDCSDERDYFKEIPVDKNAEIYAATRYSIHLGDEEYRLYTILENMDKNINCTKSRIIGKVGENYYIEYFYRFAKSYNACCLIEFNEKTKKPNVILDLKEQFDYTSAPTRVFFVFGERSFAVLYDEMIHIYDLDSQKYEISMSYSNGNPPLFLNNTYFYIQYLNYIELYSIVNYKIELKVIDFIENHYFEHVYIDQNYVYLYVDIDYSNQFMRYDLNTETSICNDDPDTDSIFKQLQVMVHNQNNQKTTLEKEVLNDQQEVEKVKYVVNLDSDRNIEVKEGTILVDYQYIYDRLINKKVFDLWTDNKFGVKYWASTIYNGKIYVFVEMRFRMGTSDAIIIELDLDEDKAYYLGTLYNCDVSLFEIRN